MTIWMIWAINPDRDDDTIWLVDAWDDESVDSNYDGWMAALAKAEQDHGARYIRVAKTDVKMDSIIASFYPVDV